MGKLKNLFGMLLGRSKQQDQDFSRPIGNDRMAQALGDKQPTEERVAYHKQLLFNGLAAHPCQFGAYHKSTQVLTCQKR
jgi:hypothetical protein